MLNWIPFLLTVLSFTIGFFFDLAIMLFINLPIIAISRGIYIYAYYLNYYKYGINEKNAKERIIVSRSEKIYFWGKNAALILLGFIYVHIGLFFGVYSLLCASIYFQKVGERKKKENLKKIGKLLYNLSPIALIGVFLILGDIIAIIPIFLALLVFLNWGNQYAKLSVDELIERYQRRRFLMMSLYLQIILIILLLSPITIIFVSLYIWNFQMIDFVLEFGLYLFNMDKILSINLPIILASRGLFLLAFYLNYYRISERDSIAVRNALFSKNKMLYFTTINIIILALGVFVMYFTVFFTIYSLFLAGLYFSELNKKNSGMGYNLLSPICYGLSIVFFVILLVAYFDIVGMIPIFICASLTIPFMLGPGLKLGRFSLKDLLDNINHQFRKKSNSKFRFVMLGYIIIFPTIFILGLSFYTPLKENYMVPMRDGTLLSTNVYYSPLAGGKNGVAPVILIRTPYNKEVFGMDYYASLYLSQGYHVVFQDIRNTFASGSKITDLMFADSYEDGVDTINWILDKHWCNGKIGTVGASALSIDTFFFAGMGPTGLVVQTQMFGVPSLYDDGIMEDCFRYDLVVNWIEATAPNNFRYQIDTIYDLLNTQDLTNPAYLATTLNAGENNWSNVNVAGLHVGGWHDVFLGGTLRGYMGYDDNGTANAKGKQALIIGPWTHGAIYTPIQGEITYPLNSIGIGKIFDWETEIFNEALLGIPTDLWDNDHVLYYLMGDTTDPTVNANKWKTADDWPLKYQWNEWYLGNKSGNMVLVDDPATLTSAANYSYLYDPRDPCPTIGGNNLGGSFGPKDQKSLLNRPDTIDFTSVVLTEPYTIEGDIKMDLFFKSDCNDTDFMVRLVDVYPDGRNMLVIDGGKMARTRESMYTMTFLNDSAPETEYNMTLNLFASAYQFNAGHQIRLIISSSNYPRYAINPNTGGDLTDHYSEGKIANNTIITGLTKSRIYFPELIT